MKNMPELKIGVVAVSRDCFPESLSVSRREALMKAYKAKYGEEDIYECPICIVESEIHMVQALEDIKKAGCNALVVYLGNFGPEISETLLAKHFDGPKMFVAAAEETGSNLIQGRGDAYCGMLNARCKSVYSGISHRDCGGMRGYDRGIPSCCKSGHWSEQLKDHQLRPPSAEFPGMQRSDPAALQPGRGDRGKFRAGSV